MLGTLTRFELKKMLGGKFFLIALCLLLVVNVLLNCGIQGYQDWQKTLEENDYFGEDPAELPGFWEYMKNAREMTALQKKNYAVFADMTPEKAEEFETAMKEKYGEDAIDSSMPTAEMLEIPGYFGGERSDYDYIMTYWSIQHGNEGIRDAQDQVIRAAQSFGREALRDGDNYGIRRNLKIIRLYSEPRKFVTGVCAGWQIFLFENPVMLLVGLLLLLACAGSVSSENDRRTWLLLHTSKNGKGKSLAAKYLAGVLCAVGITLLFQLVSLGGVYFQGGLMGLGQPAAALEKLAMLPYPLTVGQYVLVAVACQIFAAVLLSVLLTTVSALSKSSVISYAVGALLLGGCLLLVYFPPRAEWLVGPLALLNPLRYFDSYYTANLFGFPVLWVVVQAVLWSLLSVCGVFLAHKVYHRKRGAV